MVDGAVVTKHPSVKLLSHKQIKTTIYVKSKTPYVSALKRTNKFLRQLKRHGAEYVTIMGMGKAVEKTLAIGCHFQEEKGKKVIVSTQSVDVLDEIAQESAYESLEDVEEEDMETTLRKRTTSGVIVRIYP
ncbi:LANO_0E07668g1_1 [Lachancea nothofagi CBS 11611]|uniref:LANO_0E07668g1_1 n=1 Tax=Lachancea nothofagi CBS 11611 TaxID=1266666 RepID=A0A1G4JV25_9SACH|nr:LANO_0E07668g1_1 [Lachancea nothofagi CBS 11611]